MTFSKYFIKIIAAKNKLFDSGHVYFTMILSRNRGGGMSLRFPQSPSGVDENRE